MIDLMNNAIRSWQFWLIAGPMVYFFLEGYFSKKKTPYKYRGGHDSFWSGGWGDGEGGGDGGGE